MYRIRLLATTRQTLDAYFYNFVKFFRAKDRTFLCQTLRRRFGTTDATNFESRRLVFTRCWMLPVWACAGALASVLCLAVPLGGMESSGQISDAVGDGTSCGLWVQNVETRVFCHAVPIKNQMYFAMTCHLVKWSGCFTTSRWNGRHVMNRGGIQLFRETDNSLAVNCEISALLMGISSGIV